MIKMMSNFDGIDILVVKGGNWEGQKEIFVNGDLKT